MNVQHDGHSGQPQFLRVGGSTRRTAAEDSVSLRREGPLRQSPPQLLRGGAPTVEAGRAVNAGNNGFGGTRIRDQKLPCTTMIGGHEYAFGSRGSSGETSVNEAGSAGTGSGSRNTNRSTAQDWFNTLNQNVGGNANYTEYDDESPYYLPNQPKKRYHSGTVRHAKPSGQRAFTTSNTLPTGGFLDSTEESNSDSFRSVIDDLTVKNQKLKRRLKRLESLQGGKNQEGKLFEVRLHGLPAAKKNELETLLQKFAATLEEDTSAQSPKLQDSAYGSGATSIAPSNGNGGTNFSLLASRHPQRVPPSTNSELGKMKEVVRRLEQLFTGREDDEDHGGLAAGQIIIDDEGHREASMMSPVTSKRVGDMSTDNTESKAEASPSQESAAAEQRPTRPMDLDPQRKLVPEDNIEYLTHMTESGTKNIDFAQGGWVFLNLLTNLAQLHTINVTPPFIKKAIDTVSTRLELSPDGKMIRWKGGTQGTKFSSSDDSSHGNNSSEQSPEMSSSGRYEGQSSSKTNMKSTTADSALELDASGSPVNCAEGRTSSIFHYKPIFARSSMDDDDSTSVFSSDSMQSPDSQLKDISEEEKGGAGAGPRGLSRNAFKAPIIYYKGGAFCTDLSSAPIKEENAPSRLSYTRYSDFPIGAKRWEMTEPVSKDGSPFFHAEASVEREQADSMAMDVDSDNATVDLEFSPKFCQNSSAASPPIASPIELEASGIGGVMPADNFAINCETRHFILPEQPRISVSKPKSLKGRLQKRIIHRIPKSSIETFFDQDNIDPETTDASSSTSSRQSHKRPSKRHPLRHELLSAQTLRLPPSQLPPATFLFPTPTEYSDSNLDSDDFPFRSSDSEYFPTTSANPEPTTTRTAPAVTFALDAAPSTVATAGDASHDSIADPDLLLDDVSAMADQDGDSDSIFCMDSESSDEAKHDLDLLRPNSRPNLKRSRASTNSEQSGGNRKNQRVAA